MAKRITNQSVDIHCYLVKNLALIIAHIIGAIEIKTIAKTTFSKFAFTHWFDPKKYPRRVMLVTHKIAPNIQNIIYLGYFMLPAPATNGAMVRTIGMKRASITVLPPCFS